MRLRACGTAPLTCLWFNPPLLAPLLPPYAQGQLVREVETMKQMMSQQRQGNSFSRGDLDLQVLELLGEGTVSVRGDGGEDWGAVSGTGLSEAGQGSCGE